MPKTQNTGPAAPHALTYAEWTAEQLRADGPDLPAEDQMRADLADPPRNRWNAYAPPVDDLPLTIARAMWRWDRAADLAADTTARAQALREDTQRDTVARNADTTAIVAGREAHAIAELARQRAALDAAAEDMRQRAALVGEMAHANVGYLKASANGAVGLEDWLRELVGAAVAQYLDTLTDAAHQRQAILTRAARITGWWVGAARYSGSIIPAPPLPETVTLDADALSIRTDGAGNLLALDVTLAAVAASERATLARLATSAPGSPTMTDSEQLTAADVQRTDAETPDPGTTD